MPKAEDQTSRDKKQAIWTSGRRKTAAASVRLGEGRGEFSINNKEPGIYFPGKLEQEQLVAPLKAVGRNPQGFATTIKVRGGGKRAQLEAVVLGLAKAMVAVDAERNRPILKKKGFLTRDPRMKERKKYGLKKARKAPQYSKR